MRPRINVKETAMAAVFLAPSLIVFVWFAFLPFLRIMNWGLYETTRGGAEHERVGLSHYGDVLGSDDFRRALWHSVQFVIYTVPAGLVVGVLLAVAANRKLRGIKIFHTIFSTTVASSAAVTAVIFLFLLNPQFGAFKVNWINSETMAMPALALVGIWQNAGLAFIIVLAGLQSVPEEVIEASVLDGYGAVRRLLRVTLPLISPVLFFLTIILVVFGLQVYAPMDIITRGGPNGATRTLLFDIFDSRDPSAITTASVTTVGMFVVTLVVTLIQFALLEKRVHYGN